MSFWLAATRGTHKTKAAAAGAVALAVARATTTPKTRPWSTPKDYRDKRCIARRLSSDDSNCFIFFLVRLYVFWPEGCSAGSLLLFYQFFRAGVVTSFNVPSFYMFLANHSAVIQPHPTKVAEKSCCIQAGGILAATEVCCAERTAVVHAWSFFVPGPRGTREYERKQPRRQTERRAFGGNLRHERRALWQEGVINVRCCCVVYQFIEIRCARFCVDFCSSVQVILPFKFNENKFS